MIRWTTEFSVGVPDLDNEHQFLFSALNDFYEGLRLGAPKESLNELIDNVVKYTRMHFAHEENFMESVGYPELESHRAEHQAFIEKAIEFQQKFKNGKLLVSMEVTGFIKDWITIHILKMDMMYSMYLKK
jgi:hemerythrin-like metal-binding protein